jgi:hypothetical protein
MKIKAMAAKRCREMLRDRIKKEGNLQDKGYTVS